MATTRGPLSTSNLMESEHELSYHATGRRSSPSEHGGDRTRSHRIAVAERALSHLKSLVSDRDAESAQGGDWYIPPDLVQIDEEDSHTPRPTDPHPARTSDTSQASSSRVQSPTDPASTPGLMPERRFPNSHSRDSATSSLSGLNSTQPLSLNSTLPPNAGLPPNAHRHGTASPPAAADDELIRVLKMQRDSAIRAAAVFQEATEVLGSTVASHPSPAHPSYSPSHQTYSPPHTHAHAHHGGDAHRRSPPTGPDSRTHSPHRVGDIIKSGSRPPSADNPLHPHLGAQDYTTKLLLSSDPDSADPLPTEIVQHIHHLAARCSALQSSNARLLEEKDHLVEEKEHLAEEKDCLLSERHHLVAEKHHLVAEKHHLVSEKDHLAEENSNLRWQIGVGARKTSDLLDKSMTADKRAERLSMETERMGEEIMDLTQRNRELVERSRGWLGPSHVPAPAHLVHAGGEGDRIVLPPIKHHLAVPSSSSRPSSRSPPKREYRRLSGGGGSKHSPPRISDARTTTLSDTRTPSLSDARTSDAQVLDTSMPPPSLISDGYSTRMSYSRRRTPDLPRLDTGPRLDDQDDLHCKPEIKQYAAAASVPRAAEGVTSDTKRKRTGSISGEPGLTSSTNLEVATKRLRM